MLRAITPTRAYPEAHTSFDTLFSKLVFREGSNGIRAIRYSPFPSAWDAFLFRLGHRYELGDRGLASGDDHFLASCGLSKKLGEIGLRLMYGIYG